MSSVVFTLLFGVLSGLAGFAGSAPFEVVIGLGLIGITHFSIVAARKAREAPAQSRTLR